MQNVSEKIISFYNSLQLELKTPQVEVMNPFEQAEVQEILPLFYQQFYADTGTRKFIIAINPGRFGAGVTGIPFTDPVILQDVLGVQNSFEKRQELSGKFIYELIHTFGGLQAFYSQFFFTNVSPLGFLKNGKNLNYYDIPELQNELTPWMVEKLTHQVHAWGDKTVAYSLGKGKNFKVLNELNKKHQWFERIEPLPHPRWVMQYQLKNKDQILDDIIQKITRN